MAKNFELPKVLSRIKTVFDWREYPEDFKEKWYDYIDKEFTRREEGFWFYNKGMFLLILVVLITCTCSGLRLMLGHQTLGKQIDYSLYFWEACKADTRCYGMCYLKNRRSGFSFMASGEVVNLATISSDSRYGILSKSGPDAKKMFTDKVVPISVNYPFFFKPIQDGMDRPKTELAYRVPASKFTRRSITVTSKPKKPYKELQGLDTPSTGKIQVTTPTMVRNSNSSYMMNRGNGKSRTTSSTTGVLRKPH